ncbi:AAA family ATPase, partial [Salmonella enterica]|nr:AAA family ATPase [Salmonella enterica]EHT8138645.1 AAA family ATPase [Salmonella enterica]EHW3993171.1 AAA family ATPase [Salmonella enterica]EIK1734076.1 AAA family ATPase [Salmonella enterica]EIO0422756.1 AAA family ATPase [Salmonella enterica]
MDGFIPLSDLGPRICILGPSNSGKSTLAEAISNKLSCPVTHLDQLFHFPNTLWQERPENEFLRLHNEAIQNDRWVIDGNYNRCLKTRLGRATGLILLDISLPVMLKRYFYRTLLQHDRVGGVLSENQKDRISKEMLKYLVFTTPKKREQNRKIFDKCSIPKVF